MPSLDLVSAQALLKKVVSELYSKRYSPVPGALVKAELSKEANLSGSLFSERELGYRNFLAFVKDVPDVALLIRLGSDMLLAPATAGDMLSAYAKPLPRLRRDFWRAFIEFPIPGTIRLYDPIEDKIVYDHAPTSRTGIVIEPISREEQIEWRKSFANEQAEDIKIALLTALGGSGSSLFNEFARRLRENPTAMRAWNHFLQKKITDRVAEWASSNDVPKDRWSSGISQIKEGKTIERSATAPVVGQRSELYNFLDNLPIEDLLQLRVPLEWVLKVTRNQK